MNGWLKLALYAFIGIIIGSFALGILAPNNGFNMNMDMGSVPGQNMMGGGNFGYGPGYGMNAMGQRMQDWMGMGRMGGMNQGGTGMH